MPERLSTADVRHVAKLARLQLTDAEIATYRDELASILDHIGTLNELDIDDVEPMAHPLDLTNRLDDDRVGPTLPVDVLLANAPSTQDAFLAVPKVLDEGTGA